MTSYCAYNSPNLDTNGYIYSGDSILAPNSVQVTAIGGIEIVPSSNAIVVQCKGNAMPTVVIQGTDPVTLQVNTQYILDSLSASLVLPPILTSSTFDMITIISRNSAWILNKNNTSQNINIGSAMTSGSGHISGPGNQEVITLICAQQGNPERWVSFNVTGNITVS